MYHGSGRSCSDIVILIGRCWLLCWKTTALIVSAVITVKVTWTWLKYYHKRRLQRRWLHYRQNHVAVWMSWNTRRNHNIQMTYKSWVQISFNEKYLTTTVVSQDLFIIKLEADKISWTVVFVLSRDFLILILINLLTAIGLTPGGSSTVQHSTHLHTNNT